MGSSKNKRIYRLWKTDIRIIQSLVDIIPHNISRVDTKNHRISRIEKAIIKNCVLDLKIPSSVALIKYSAN